MLLQHCIASSGDVMAPQSIAYAPIARATAMSKIVFERRIQTKLCGLSVEVKSLAEAELSFPLLTEGRWGILRSVTEENA